MFHRLSRNHATDGAFRTNEQWVMTAIAFYSQSTPNAALAGSLSYVPSGLAGGTATEPLTMGKIRKEGSCTSWTRPAIWLCYTASRAAATEATSPQA